MILIIKYNYFYCFITMRCATRMCTRINKLLIFYKTPVKYKSHLFTICILYLILNKTVVYKLIKLIY